MQRAWEAAPECRPTYGGAPLARHRLPDDPEEAWVWDRGRMVPIWVPDEVAAPLIEAATEELRAELAEARRKAEAGEMVREVAGRTVADYHEAATEKYDELCWGRFAGVADLDAACRRYDEETR